MFEKRICCFAGHRDDYTVGVIEHVKRIAKELIEKENVNEFWVGKYGNFDASCAKAIRELKEIYPYVKLILVIPYISESINKDREYYYKKYDSILVADVPANTPKRFYIVKANEFIVKNSQFMICNICRSWGGAVRTYEYAKRKKLKIFNIAESLQNHK